MLNHVQIRNFAIIDEIELELGHGLTVLSGETGAGKSILVDALGLVLGARADAGGVRHGAKRAEITASFDLSNDAASRHWLEQQSLDEDDECLIRRIINSDGRSRAYINGHSVSLQSLKALGEHLVDIHGQHSHQSIMRPVMQKSLLDSFAGHRRLLGVTRDAFEKWSGNQRQLAELQARAENREARIELLSYQVRELQSAAPQPEESQGLEHEQVRLANSAQLAVDTNAALDDIYERDQVSAHAVVSRAIGSLRRLSEIDASLTETCALLEQAEIQLGEAADNLRRYADHLEPDPTRLAAVDERLATLRELARKHRVEPDELPALSAKLQAELRTLGDADTELERLVAELESDQRHYLETAERLSAARAKGARELGERVSTAMQQLGMPGGQFAVALERRDLSRARADGLDDIEFRVAANPGQPARALARVASGGELSRISLAIQVVALDDSRLPCMVFDEVDSGVGGGIAEIVGRRLRELGEQHQVLCVTHLPQVASQGHLHMRVSKLADERTVRTVIRELTTAERIEELARMLGGVEITDRTRAHAEEMLGKVVVI